MQGVLRLGDNSDASTKINLLRNRNTPNYFDNNESKDFATNRLLSYEHVRDTEVLRSTDTHSNDNSVHESDDAYIGSQEFQPEVRVRDVRINIFDPLNCRFFHVLIMITSMLFFLLGLWKTDFNLYFIITFHVFKTV